MFDPSGQYELQVAPNGRAAADEYLHQGAMWIEGREGSRYVLRFINRSSQRVCVIFSVDGLDVIKGQPAGPNSDGYIVDAESTLEIPGWKLDSSTAAEFYFNKIGKSYAAQSSANTSNVGVIGAMVFREQVWQQPSQFMYTTARSIGMGMSNPNMLINVNGTMGMSGTLGLAGSLGTHDALGVTCSDTMSTSASLSGSIGAVASSAIPIEQSVGTGFGDATDFATSQTQFIKAHATVPDAMLVLYYNTAKNLQKMGIVLRTKGTRYDNSAAKAFPAYTNGCTPPPGWKP